VNLDVGQLRVEGGRLVIVRISHFVYKCDGSTGVTEEPDLRLS
jgi:hypothetical protein